MDQTLRPEYVDAVDAVRLGWTLWLTLILPAAIIWTTVLARPLTSSNRRAAIGCGAFALACFLFWILTITHGNRIQSTKELHMETDAEMDDWASDTWHSLAPFTAVPISVIYCTVHMVGAFIVQGFTRLLMRLVRPKPAFEGAEDEMNPTNPASQNPYTPPRTM
jgi:hypothetical protein